MREESQRPGSAPGAFDGEVPQGITYELADPRCPVHVGNDLQQKGRGAQGVEHRLRVHLYVLIAHGAGRDPDAIEFEGADERILVHSEFGTAQLLREPPKLPSSGNRGMIVEVLHRALVSTDFALEAHRDHLSRLAVVADLWNPEFS